jgi:hypothetical protein
MKKTSILLFSMLFASLLIFQACNKYEDGPSVSLRSAKARLCNTWVLDQVLVNGIDITSTYSLSFKEMVLTFRTDNSYVKSFIDQNNVPYTIEGTWAFINDNVSLTVSVSGIVISTFTILRLASKELWLRESYNSIIYDVHYKLK